MMLSTLPVPMTSLILTASLRSRKGRAGDPHFTNVDTEIGNGYVSCPGLQRGLGANLKLGDRCVLLWGHPLSSMGSFLDSCWKLKPQRGDECSNPDDLI